MSEKMKKIILISVLLLVLIIVIIIKKFENKNISNTVSFNEVVIQNEETSNTLEETETIKVHITGEVNNPRTY